MGTIDAMKQWLEVLEYWDIHGGLNQPTEDAIASLRQAIADLESQEPVGFAGIEMWTVAEYEGEGGGYIVVDEDGNENDMGFVFDTAHEAQKYANALNKAMDDDYDDGYY